MPLVNLTVPGWALVFQSLLLCDMLVDGSEQARGLWPDVCGRPKCSMGCGQAKHRFGVAVQCIAVCCDRHWGQVRWYDWL
jgi:hypothetical protein